MANDAEEGMQYCMVDGVPVNFGDDGDCFVVGFGAHAYSVETCWTSSSR